MVDMLLLLLLLYIVVLLDDPVAVGTSLARGARDVQGRRGQRGYTCTAAWYIILLYVIVPVPCN